MTVSPQLCSGPVDMHAHIIPESFPENTAHEPRWPCMHHRAAGKATVMMGDKPFREIDDRSWDINRRLEDMDKDGIAVQALSPMPELLSYWFGGAAADSFTDYVNASIAGQVTRAPQRFVGLGIIPMQDTALAIRHLDRVRSVYGLAGIEIGSNINGLLLGDPQFEPIFEAAEALGIAIFVHALHPIATAGLTVDPAYVPLVGFPVDVAMTAASLIMAGILTRYPRLRIAFSHGGGALAPILHRLDFGWQATPRLQDRLPDRPTAVAARMFYDSNVYAPDYLRYLTHHLAPDHIFIGTDYPYAIMQHKPLGYTSSADLSPAAHQSLLWGAAHTFLGRQI